MRSNSFLLCAFFLGVLLTAGCAPAARTGGPEGEPYAPPRSLRPANGRLFTSLRPESGIRYGRQGREKLIGQAWGDYDGDGWLDLYLTDDDGPNVLYRNQGDGTFAVSPLSESVSLPDGESSGAIFADYDNDGWSDLLVLQVGANVLFHNERGQRFVDVSAAAGLLDRAHSKTASWGDYDEDGYLDLYIANWACYPNCGRPVEGDMDRLYRNRGDGTFEDVTGALSRPRGAGFVASFIDFDNDGDLDIYLVNDNFINPIGNVLWRNEGTADGCRFWCFTDISAAAGADSKVMGMGLASGDYDNDGDLDLYFSNVGPMTLLQNQGNGTFADVSKETGTDLGRSWIGWGAVFFDYDNDGWQDLYLAVSDEQSGAAPADALLHNDGRGRFDPVPPEVSGLDAGGRTLGVAYADYDNDGWVDLLVGNFDGPYVLYRNAGSESAYRRNRRVTFRLVGGGPINRDAVGARVTVALDDGRVQMQEVVAGSSLGAGNSLLLHFGLGRANIEGVRVTWPDGTAQDFPALEANRRYTFTYPDA